MYLSVKSSTILLLIVVFSACGNSNQQQSITNLSSEEAANKIDQAIQNDEYAKALAIIEQNSTLNNIDELKEKTYLNYALYHEYRSKASMRDRMNDALRYFIKTLEVNPENAKARAEIHQILGVYQTFPNRSPQPGIVDTLKQMNLYKQ